MMFTDKITLYNHMKTQSGDAWKRTVLDLVMVVRKTEKTVSSDGVIHRHPVLSITVPFRPGYTDAKEYDGTGFTFGLDNLDFVILGECALDIGDGMTVKDLKNRPDCGTVKALEDNTNRDHLPHWQITCEA